MVQNSAESAGHELVQLNVPVKHVNSEESKVQQTHPNNVIDEMDVDSDVRGDRKNLALLIFLYLLQGIPLSLTNCIPMLLQKRGASYQTQAKFTVVYWPYNLKFIWAPIIDSLYSRRFGRRKSWLVPVQILIGLFMIVLSLFIDRWLGNKEQDANIGILAVIFFIMTMLGCTQDIIVDGWALTMLKRRNIGYASICNNLGNPLGYILGYALVISLESAEFCNRYLRSEPQDVGIITLSGYLWFWGFMFLLITALIAILKKETDYKPAHDLGRPTNTREYIQHIWNAYRMAINILKIPSIRILAAVLFTIRFIWADYDGVAYLKFLNSGVDNEKMIPMQAFTSIPVQFFISLLAARFTRGRRPTKIFMIAIPIRTLFALSGALIIWITPMTIPADGVAPNYIYYVYLINSILYSLTSFCMHVVLTAFFVKISDPTVGGTYMTMLNTIDNLGWTWPHTLTLWAVEYFTWRDCGIGNNAEVKLMKQCPIVINGYFIETGICFLFGLFWYKWGISKLKYLNQLPTSKWKVAILDK